MNKKAFLLSDSLICVLITGLVTLLVFSLYRQLDKNMDIQDLYYYRSNENYKALFEDIEECECLYAS